MVNDNGIGTGLVLVSWLVIGYIYILATEEVERKKITAFVKYAHYTMVRRSLRRAERRANKLSRKARVLKKQFNEAAAWFR